MASGSHRMSGNTCGFGMLRAYRRAVMWCYGSILGVTVYFQFPRVWHHSKRWRQWAGVKGGTTRNGHSDPKCPSARHLRMVLEDTVGPREGATCAWMVADEAVGLHFLRCGGLLDDWSVECVLSLVFV
ncbi:uncharacterized protein TNCV_4972431 [Trichonephila clavipes]|nr:uncharacterized protein TNCV_4972431 [Trichonephila clavipes]